jgi:small subunit ribosomal protein S11
MGKKRVIKQQGTVLNKELRNRALSKVAARKIGKGLLSIQATYNNTLMSLSDEKGNVLVWSSSGALGFAGAKKGTPFAAAKVGELMGDKALLIGVKDVDVLIRGVGAGRESALRSFAGKGIGVTKITDDTPVPHNGPRPPKPRRV